jgi:hypothetical protein
MGTMTINTDAGQDTRLVAAYTDLLQPTDGNGDPRDATAAEIKARVIQDIKGVVLGYETREANKVASAAVPSFDPT